MKLMKKILAGILSVALLATVLMTTAFADDKYEVIELPYEASVHGCFNDGYATVLNEDGIFMFIDEKSVHGSTIIGFKPHLAKYNPAYKPLRVAP